MPANQGEVPLARLGKACRRVVGAVFRTFQLLLQNACGSWEWSGSDRSTGQVLPNPSLKASPIAFTPHASRATAINTGETAIAVASSFFLV